MRGVSGTIKNESKEQKVGLLVISVGALAASFLGIYYQGKKLSHKLMEQLEMVRIFNAISAFNKFGNTNMSSKRNLNLMGLI